MGRGHVVDGVGVDAGGIHQIAGGEISLAGVDQPAAAGFLDAGDLGFQMKPGPVADGGFRQSQTVFPGGTDGGGGSVEGGLYLVRQLGVHTAGLVAGEDFQAGHAVGVAPGLEGVQGGALLRGEGQHKRAAGPIGDVQLLAQLPGQSHTPHVEPGHQGAGQGIIAGVENGGIGLGGAVGHVVFLLQNAHPDLVFGELKGRGGAHNAAADDEYIVHKQNLDFCLWQLDKDKKAQDTP